MLIELVFDLLDIKQLRTTAYHPACDGQSERTIRTVKGMIRSFVEENQSNWDFNLQLLQLAYNSSVHSCTGETPFKMRFGVNPRMPWDVIFAPETQPREARVEEGQQLFDGQLISARKILQRQLLPKDTYGIYKKN